MGLLKTKTPRIKQTLKTLIHLQLMGLYITRTQFFTIPLILM
ncbi:Putative uncharacterized protein [Moritella viscosa]|uniref:Uncharacterized protein n=1 Tax=Moritella viscosa TaxID=80854 RepID=A0A1L0CL17_9GAMM|nr:Putative uncharacterized protein [Moritella viscosa]